MGTQQDGRRRLEGVRGWIRHRATALCYRVLDRLENKTHVPLFDLSPTSDAKNVQPYLDRLSQLLEHRSDRVHEIAVTGPYSSGKTSLLKTFERRNPQHQYIWISLASFDDPKKDHSQAGDKSVQSLEKSIVQQLLYRSKSEAVSSSRFRRIYTRPMTPLFRLVFLTWLIVTGYLYSTHALKWDTFLLPIESLHYWLMQYSTAVGLYLMWNGLSALRRFGITKLSFSNVEVDFDGKSDSVFNEYMEEILYHLKSNKTDIVIFEDLDRFPGNEIFVRLKELNTIINLCEDIERPVRFIYAVQDDLFKNAERVKFFDAIIPVIPITNESNAYPIFKGLLEEAGLVNDIDDNMLREVMIYVDDMRILKNIVNEFTLYRAILSKYMAINRTVQNQLMGFMIYKNCYCDDFAKLHQSEGVLVDLFNAANQVREDVRQELEQAIEPLSAKLTAAENDILNSIEELNILFHYPVMMEYIRLVGQIAITSLNGIPINHVVKPDKFRSLLEAQHIDIQNAQGRRAQKPNQYAPLLQQDHPYQRRLHHIESKHHKKQEELRAELQRLHHQATEAASLPVERLCKEHRARWRQQVDAVKNKAERSEKEIRLLLALMENAYLDEQYHKFIAIFKPGHISSNDHAFVLSVNNSEPLEPTYSLDDVKTVYEYLRGNSRLHNRAFLNFYLIDYLLGINDTVPLKAMLASLPKETAVMRILWDSVNHLQSVEDWLHLLTHTFTGYWELLTQSELTHSEKYPLLTQSLLQITSLEINTVLSDTDRASLQTYLDKESGFFNALPIEKQERNRLLECLASLQIRLCSLEGIAQADSIQSIFDHRLYQFTPGNILKIFNARQDSNFSLPLRYEDLMEDRALSEKLTDYRETVGIWVLENTLSISSSEGWLEFLNDPHLNDDLKQKLVEHPDCRVEKIQAVENKSLWNTLVSGRKMTCSWENVLVLLEAQGDEQLAETLLSDYVNDPKIVNELVDQPKEHLDTDAKTRFQDYILGDHVQLEAFQRFERYLAQYTAREDIPKISDAKLSYLISNEGFDAPDMALFEIIRERDPRLGLALLEAYPKTYLAPETIETINPDAKLLTLIDGSQTLETTLKKRLYETSNFVHERILQDNALPSILTPHRPYILDTSIPKLTDQQIESIIDSKSSQDVKKLLLAGQIQYIQPAQAVSFLRVIEEEYGALAEVGNSITRGYSKSEETLAQALKHHECIREFKVSGSGLLLDKKTEITYFS